MLRRRAHALPMALATTLTAIVTAIGVDTVHAQGDPTGDPAFIPPGARLQKLVDGNEHDLIFAEGPVVTCDGMVMWSDITFTNAKPGAHGGLRAGNIMRYDPATSAVSVYRSPSGMSNGLRIDLNCNLLAAEGADYGGRRLTRTDLKTGRAEVVTGLYDGKPYNALNDIAIDSKGRIYFSDPRYLGHEPIEQAMMAVYRVDTDLSVHRVVSDAGKPNGVAVCPDEKHLFVVSNDNGAFDLLRIAKGEMTTKGAMALLRYDLSPEGTASNRTVLVDYLPEDGPDGLVCDSEGNLWVAVRDQKRPGIYAYTPDGEEKGYIPTTIPTNVHFGRGENASYLYVTADNSLYGIQVGKQGHHLQ
ncbi:MAG: SMP-30/gluconolactonase/LRE family protein [Gammaproteobacteria bacterium]